MSTRDEALERGALDFARLFVRRADERARKIRTEVGEAGGGAAVLRLRAADDLETCAAAVAALLPADTPGRVTLLPEVPAPGSTSSTSPIMEPVA